MVSTGTLLCPSPLCFSRNKLSRTCVFSFQPLGTFSSEITKRSYSRQTSPRPHSEQPSESLLIIRPASCLFVDLCYSVECIRKVTLEIEDCFADLICLQERLFFGVHVSTFFSVFEVNLCLLIPVHMRRYVLQ